MAIVDETYLDKRQGTWHAHAPWFVWHPVNRQHQTKDERRAHRVELRAHKKRREE